MMNFQSLMASVMPLQHGPYGRVLNIRDFLDVFDDRVDEAIAVLEEGRQYANADIAVLIDRGGEHGTAVLPEPLRIIGAATEKRDPKWGAADDHWARVAARNAARSLCG